MSGKPNNFNKDLALIQSALTGVPVGGALGGTLPDPTGSGTSGTLPWFNVTDSVYGAVGDGTTDDTAAVNAAIAALIAAGSGVLYFPAGTYKVTSALTTLSVPCTVRGDGSASYDNTEVVSEVAFYSTTAVCFTVSTKYCRFEGIAIANFSGLSVSAGAGVLVDSSYLEQRCDFENVWVGGFYDNIDIKVGAQWVMHACMNIAPVRYGLRIRNTVNGDAGDWSISDCNFSAENFDSDAAIRIESSGGGKITNVKINMALDGKKFNHGIDVAVASSLATADLLVSNTSIENVRTHGIKMTTSSGTSTWAFVILTGLQIAVYNTTGNAINIAATTLGDVKYVEISNSAFAANAGSSQYAISLTKVNVAKVDGQSLEFGGGFLTTSGCTSVFDASGGVGNNVYISGVPTSGQVPTASSGTAATWQTPTAAPSFATPAIVLGTAAAAGAAATIIRSDATIVAFDATVPADIPGPGVASAAGSVAKAARRDHTHALTYHDEVLTDGASNIIFDGGDVVMVTGVPN